MFVSCIALDLTVYILPKHPEVDQSRIDNFWSNLNAIGATKNTAGKVSKLVVNAVIPVIHRHQPSRSSVTTVSEEGASALGQVPVPSEEATTGQETNNEVPMDQTNNEVSTDPNDDTNTNEEVVDPIAVRHCVFEVISCQCMQLINLTLRLNSSPQRKHLLIME